MSATDSAKVDGVGLLAAAPGGTPEAGAATDEEAPAGGEPDGAEEPAGAPPKTPEGGLAPNKPPPGAGPGKGKAGGIWL